MTATEFRTRTASNVTLHVGAPGPAVATEAAALLNESLGSGFIRPSALAELTTEGGGVLIRARGRDGDLLGATTARVLDQKSHTALQDRLRLATVDAGLEGRPVGELKSIVVAPAARGMGLGTVMLAASLDFLKAGGCRYVVSASWVSADPQHSSLGLLERAGFAQLATIPCFWADDQKDAGYLCPTCGPECVCAAIILVLPLDDWPGVAGSR
jgi:ribosomal protein S18 acetylase RimI-like enzyme